jgi:ABC-type polysaccharide/polyol phosphate transport system ATPase subunit
MTIAIATQGLGKSYRLYDRPMDRLREILSFGRHSHGHDVWALKDVTFSVAKGEMLGIVGRNGAGKSTLLRVLAGRLKPSSGSVQVNGHVSAILELGTGMNPSLTGRENARINALFMGLDPWRIEDQLDRILEFAELGQYGDQPFETYSLGMRSRLAFAVLTVLEPEILLLDEALSAGDARFAKKCTRFMRDMCKSGCTSIVVSHDLLFLQESCDRLLWIDQGRLVAQGSPREVIARYVDQTCAPEDLGRARPRELLFRIAAEDGAEVEYPLHYLQWLDATSEREVGAVHFGLDLSPVLSRTAEYGFVGPALARPWGSVVTHASESTPFRLVRPHLGPGGAAYFVAPVPQPPQPFPAGLRIWGENHLARDLVLSVLINGSFRELLRFGRPGEGNAREHSHYSSTALMTELLAPPVTASVRA